MDISIETVTPKKAQQYLNRNSLNRKLRNGVVERYADDMRNNLWTQCTAPIVFYDDGNIADGQHRLWAVVESGKKQTFVVARNLGREAGLNIDTGVQRSVIDASRIAGVGENLSHALISTCRAFHFGNRAKTGGKGRSASHSEKLQWVDAYREPCEWAIHHGPAGKFLRNSITLAAMARAYLYEQDRERLARFAEVLTNGFSQDDTESAAVAIRNYLMQKGSHASTDQLWTDTFLKVQNALWYFMHRKALYVIKTQTAERYPGPLTKGQS